MPVYESNKTFCGVNTTWIPRLSNTSAIISCAVPTVVAWFFVLGNLYHIKKVTTWKGLRIIALVYVSKIIWEAIDVTLDAYLFYQLEMGEILDKNIIRNTNVNNAILAFAVFGCIKISFWYCAPIYLQVREENWKDDIDLRNNEDKDKEDQIPRLKYYMILFTFYFEDGPELILEYHYIEKYVTDVQPLWYLFFKDVVIALISFYMIVDVLVNYYCKQGAFAECNISINVILIGTLMLIRVGAAGYQYITGKLERSCFVVNDTKLFQTPFASGCLREVDYAIIVICFLLLLMLIRNIQYTIYYFKAFEDSIDALS